MKILIATAILMLASCGSSTYRPQEDEFLYKENTKGCVVIGSVLKTFVFTEDVYEGQITAFVKMDGALTTVNVSHIVDNTNCMQDQL